jgi:hypothetical protein
MLSQKWSSGLAEEIRSCSSTDPAYVEFVTACSGVLEDLAPSRT